MLGMTLDDVESRLGEFHATVESMFYTPAYVLDNGYMVYLVNEVPKSKGLRDEGIIYWIKIVDSFEKDTTIIKEFRNLSYLKN